jgi:hypothetical protein
MRLLGAGAVREQPEDDDDAENETNDHRYESHSSVDPGLFAPAHYVASPHKKARPQSHFCCRGLLARALSATAAPKCEARKREVGRRVMRLTLELALPDAPVQC